MASEILTDAELVRAILISENYETLHPNVVGNALKALLISHAALAKQAEEMRDAAATLSRIAHLGYGGPNLRHAIEQVNTLLAATAAKQTKED